MQLAICNQHILLHLFLSKAQSWTLLYHVYPGHTGNPYFSTCISTICIEALYTWFEVCVFLHCLFKWDLSIPFFCSFHSDFISFCLTLSGTTGTQDPSHFSFIIALTRHTPWKNSPTSSVHLLLSAGISFTEALLASRLKAYVAICWPLLTVQVSLQIVTLYINSCLQLKLQKNEFLHLVTQSSTEYLQCNCCLPLS